MAKILIFRTKLKSNLVVEEGYFSIVYIEQGHLILQLGAQEKTVTQGHILINTPASPIKLLFLSEDLEVFGLLYTINYLSRIKKLNDFHNSISYFKYLYLPIWDLTSNEQLKIVELLEKLKSRKSLYGHHPFADQLFNLTFSEFILELIHIGSKQDKQTFNRYNRSEYLVLQFIILARDHYKEQVQLEYYADRLNVSIKYLSETVKAVTGKTAKEILLDLRMAQARLLLSNSDRSITEIAYDLSYDSLASFSKSFKQFVGVSPKVYRSSHL